MPREDDQSRAPIWDQIYEGGHEQRAPWDTVVSFVYRNRPQDKVVENTRLVEVGYGTASNLRFFAREGFQVAGVEGAEKAVQVAQAYFSKHGLTGDLRHGDYRALPFEDSSFDLAFDRAALVHAGTSVQREALAEVHRVLVPGGRFLYTPYADTHASCLSGAAGPDDLIVDIAAGTLTGVGPLRFVSREDIEQLFPEDRWTIRSLEYQTSQDLLVGEAARLHSSWRVIVEKI